MCTSFCEPAEKYSAHRPIQSHSVHGIIRFRWAVLRWFFFSYALSQPHESNVTIISTVVVVIIISVSTLNVFHLCLRITLILQNENWDKTKAKAQSVPRIKRAIYTYTSIKYKTWKEKNRKLFRMYMKQNVIFFSSILPVISHWMCGEQTLSLSSSSSLYGIDITGSKVIHGWWWQWESERMSALCTHRKLVILSQKIYICIIDLCRNWAEA